MQTNPMRLRLIAVRIQTLEDVFKGRGLRCPMADSFSVKPLRGLRTQLCGDIRITNATTKGKQF
jgi:hypothetical protein